MTTVLAALDSNASGRPVPSTAIALADYSTPRHVPARTRGGLEGSSVTWAFDRGR